MVLAVIYIYKESAFRFAENIIAAAQAPHVANRMKHTYTFTMNSSQNNPPITQHKPCLYQHCSCRAIRHRRERLHVRSQSQRQSWRACVLVRNQEPRWTFEL
jgi:hypothetical protein